MVGEEKPPRGAVCCRCGLSKLARRLVGLRPLREGELRGGGGCGDVDEGGGDGGGELVALEQCTCGGADFVSRIKHYLMMALGIAFFILQSQENSRYRF